LAIGWAYLVRRVIFAAVTFLALTFLTYVIAGSVGSPSIQRQLLGYFHLNQPIFEGYFLWLAQVLQGNLGVSLTGEPVSSTIFPWLFPTVILEVPAILTGVALGLLVGVFSASRFNTKADRAINGTSAMLFSIPAYWLATIFILVFSLSLRLLPSFGMISPYPPYWWGSPQLDVVAHYILPFSVLVLVSAPMYVRVARASAAEVLSKEWVTAMKVSSIGNRRLLYRHVLKNSAGPVLSLFVYNMAVFLAASPGIDVAFSWPGLGYRFAKAALGYDFPVMLGIIILMGLIAVIVSLASDILQASIDPRISL
jgi:peptide/nickel transport system permease protein